MPPNEVEMLAEKIRRWWSTPQQDARQDAACSLAAYLLSAGYARIWCGDAWKTHDLLVPHVAGQAVRDCQTCAEMAGAR